ncbi:MAG TPA: hypothetical protein VED47_03690 [Burkholderiaceae bacterium]|nr:hypothetical protein [Burkholderiaceae bacterium]
MPVFACQGFQGFANGNAGGDQCKQLLTEEIDIKARGSARARPSCQYGPESLCAGSNWSQFERRHAVFGEYATNRRRVGRIDHQEMRRTIVANRQNMKLHAEASKL